MFVPGPHPEKHENDKSDKQYKGEHCHDDGRRVVGRTVAGIVKRLPGIAIHCCMVWKPDEKTFVQARVHFVRVFGQRTRF